MGDAVRNAMRSQCGRNATDGRTNERRGSHAVVDHLSAVDAGAHIDGFTSIGESIERGFLPDGTRHEVTRIGGREPIPNHVRSAVWYRDHGRCELCGTRELATPWELDHITPWSAGGSNDSTNLRVLCQQHNQSRSNFVDPAERPRRAATWWCVNCYGVAVDEQWWTYLPGGIVWCPIHRGSRACPIVRNYRWEYDNLDEPANWHERGPIEDAHTVAHCAHCNAPGLTDQPL